MDYSVPEGEHLGTLGEMQEHLNNLSNSYELHFETLSSIRDTFVAQMRLPKGSES
ncbi:MAG: hypothetical protein QGH20_09815 [Candidatus Latescibacteria bacterium]|nr:hypothetical protein [Candidatus Latescibacterota bacterium]